MAEKAKAETAAQASSASEAAASKDAETAAAEKAAETESEIKAETAAQASSASEPDAEKSDGGLPFTAKDGRVAIVSKARAGKKIIAKTGEVIEFGSDGKASVHAEDAAYLSAIAGFEFE